VLARTAAERELAEYKRGVRDQLRERDAYEVMLRAAGLLPLQPASASVTHSR
jgi:hypothetical protein